jgi:hypothetical protein
MMLEFLDGCKGLRMDVWIGDGPNPVRRHNMHCRGHDFSRCGGMDLPHDGRDDSVIKKEENKVKREKREKKEKHQ